MIIKRITQSIFFTSIIVSTTNVALAKCEKPVVKDVYHVDCVYNGFASVKRGNKYSFVDNKGKIVIPIKYELPFFLFIKNDNERKIQKL